MADDAHRPNVPGHARLAHAPARGACRAQSFACGFGGSRATRISRKDWVPFVLHDMLAVLFDQGPFHHGAIAIGDKEARKPHWPSRAQSGPKVPDANLASQPEVFDAFDTAARGGRSPHFLAVGPVRPVGACERGYANRRSRGTAVFA
jgi:hypothetical protein